ncbi:MAG: bifunctional adenosylcobinamide kinase/adenosylcobinamide-phosphate guanylyltransferase [Geminicoccaceae bacterium]
MGEQATCTLVLGGARSGKSRLAEGLALHTDLRRIYVATAQAHDDDMRARIAAHRARRDAGWQTIEEPIALAACLTANTSLDTIVLVDCLTLWLTNHLLAGHDLTAVCDELTTALADLSGPVILVSNEVGQGVVPVNAMARRFVDHAGWLHQAIAARADAVAIVHAGLPHWLKGAPN